MLSGRRNWFHFVVGDSQLANAGVDVNVAVPTVSSTTADMFATYFDTCVNDGSTLLVTLQYIRWDVDGAKLELCNQDLEGDDELVDLSMVLDASMPKQKKGFGR